MLKEATYKEKFATLSHWLPMVVDSIKKDLKNEHLKQDLPFTRHYFAGKNPNKLTTEELVQAYESHLTQGENIEELGEFIANRWLLKNTGLYHLFEQELSKINPHFQEMETIESSLAIPLMEKAVAEFGAPNTYLFCVLNSVVFPKDVYAILERKAKESQTQAHEEEKIHREKESLDALHRNYQQQIARLTDKFEKKILGLQKKYLVDTENLKKQIVAFQRKLNG